MLGAGLFRDKNALELDRLSVEVLGRSSEIKNLRRTLSGIDQGFLPKLVSVYGLPGSGKTLVARKICEEYAKKFSDRFRFVYVNLGEVKTVFSCANKLLVALGGVWKPGKSGLDGVMEDFWRKILEWKGEIPRFMLIVLDEADNLFMDKRSDPSGFLYRLVRNEERLEGSGIKLSLITISNQLITEIWELDARVRSSIGFEEVLFTPYSIQELYDILSERCREAFNPDIVDPDVIKECAAYTGEESRDVRKMLEVMRLCGEIAENENAKKVEMKHYNKIVKFLSQDHDILKISGLPQTHLILLGALAWELEVEGKPTLTSKRLYDLYHYNQVESGAGNVALSYRRISGVLKELEVMNLIGSRNIFKGRGGQSSEIWLKISAQSVLNFTNPLWREAKQRLEEQEKKRQELQQNMNERKRKRKRYR